jgi:hypothetical protein
MRGLQLSHQWRVIRAIDASPNGLTVTEIIKQEETGIRKTHRDPEALQATGVPPYTERVERPTRSAFMDISEFQFPQRLRNRNKAAETGREKKRGQISPADFMFELTKEEYEGLRRQIGTLKRGEHSKYLPMAFTEQGEDNSDFLRITS